MKVKVDLAKFKLKANDGKIATLIHPSGHEVRLAIHALHPENRKNLDKLELHEPAIKMAEGGKPESVDAYSNNLQGQLNDAKAAAAEYESGRKSQPEGAHDAPRGNPDPAPVRADKYQEFHRNVQKSFDGSPKKMSEGGDPGEDLNALRRSYGPQSLNLDPAQPLPDSLQANTPGVTPEDMPDQGDRPYGTPAMGGQPAPASQPAAPPVSAPNALQGASAPPSATTPADLPKETPKADPNAYSPDYLGGANKVAQGIQGQATQEQAIQAQAAAQFKGQAQAASDMMLKYQTTFDRLNRERQDLTHDIQNSHIDPSHYLGSMDTGDKILTGISLALGGLGGGAHGSNQALEFLNRQIDRDIDAQKAQLDIKHTLLSANMQQFGNLREATEMTRLMMHDQISNKVQELAAKSNSATAQARAQQLLGNLEMQTAPVAQQLAMRKMLIDGANKAEPGQDTTPQTLQMLRVMNPQMAKEMEGRYVPGVGMASVPVPDKTRDTLIARQSLQEQVGKLRDWAQKHSGDMNPADVSYGHALANSVQDAYRRANGQGVFREAESEFVKGIVEQDPTKFLNKFRVDPKYKALEDSNLGELNAVRQGYGLKPAAGRPEIKVKEGVKYVRGPDGKAISVQ